jgi:hypothetical protein
MHFHFKTMSVTMASFLPIKWYMAAKIKLWAALKAEGASSRVYGLGFTKGVPRKIFRMTLGM